MSMWFGRRCPRTTRCCPGDTLMIEPRKMVETAPPATVANREGNTISLQWVRPEDPRFVWTVESGGTLWLAHRSMYRFDRLTFLGDTVRTVQVGDVPPPPAAEDEFVPILAALASSPEGMAVGSAGGARDGSRIDLGCPGQLWQVPRHGVRSGRPEEGGGRPGRRAVRDLVRRNGDRLRAPFSSAERGRYRRHGGGMFLLTADPPVIGR